VCGSPGMMRVEKVGGLVCRTSAGWAWRGRVSVNDTVNRDNMER
jgi:hypothetical protein